MSLTWTVDATKRRVHITVVGPATRDEGRNAVDAIVAQPGFESDFAIIFETIGQSAPTFVHDVMHALSTQGGIPGCSSRHRAGPWRDALTACANRRNHVAMDGPANGCSHVPHAAGGRAVVVQSLKPGRGPR